MKGLIYKEEIISTRNIDIVSLVWKLTHSVGSLCVFMSLDQKAETEINGHENLFQFLRKKWNAFIQWVQRNYVWNWDSS